MTRLSYIISDGLCLLNEGFYGSADSVRLTFEGVKEGVLQLSDCSFALRAGGVKTDLSAAADGKIYPTLTTSEGSFKLEPFIKRGGKILPVPTEEGVIRLGIKKLLLLEKRLKELEEKLDNISLRLGSYYFTDCD